MKKFLIFFVFICALPCMAAVQISGYKNDGLDSLRGEIKTLEKQLAQKTETLNKCAAKNKNFQIAGIATVGLAGAGVATNISLHSKIQNQKKQVANMNNTIDTAKMKVDIFSEEMKELDEKMKNGNIDMDKVVQKLNAQFTETEKERLWELFEKKPDTVSESDKLLLQKFIHIMRECQK